MLAIEINSDYWSVAGVKGSISGMQFDGQSVLAGATTGERLESLKGYFVASGTKDRRAVIVLSRAEVITRTVELPARKAEAVGGMLRFEIEKHIPYSADDASYGYQILKRKKNAFVVLFSVARKGYVEKLAEDFMACGIEPVSIVTWQTALYNALAYGKDVGEDENSAIIAFNGDEATVDVFSGSMPVYSRTVDTGGLGREQRASLLERELRFSFCAIDASVKDRKLDRLFVVSPESPDEGLLSSLSRYAKLPVAVLGQARQSVQLGAFLAASGKGRLKVNLAPKMSMDISASGFLPAIALCALLTLLLLATGGSYLVKDQLMIRRLEHALSGLKERKAVFDRVADSVSSVNARIGALEEIKKGSSPGSLKVLKELTIALPDDTWLDGFEYGSTRVSIEGFSKSASMLMLKLEKSKAFDGLELEAPVTKADSGMERFRMRFKLMDEGT